MKNYSTIEKFTMLTFGLVALVMLNITFLQLLKVYEIL
jgi:hypothetical protein